MTKDGFDGDGNLVVDEPNDPETVASIQRALRDLKYDVKVTRVYDDQTYAAVAQFKVDQQLAIPPGARTPRRGDRAGDQRASEYDLYAAGSPRSSARPCPHPPFRALSVGGAHQLPSARCYASDSARAILLLWWVHHSRNRGCARSNQPRLLPRSCGCPAAFRRWHDDAGAALRDDPP
ncbi:peptidoglycan-binding protein [Micropruina sp.]|uniref:peptidoglycan-binding protein n=1 Tax=Micropruina sp. TaxID=2737536 RepID=UPI0039E2726B